MNRNFEIVTSVTTLEFEEIVTEKYNDSNSSFVKLEICPTSTTGLFSFSNNLNFDFDEIYWGDNTKSKISKTHTYANITTADVNTKIITITIHNCHNFSLKDITLAEIFGSNTAFVLQNIYFGKGVNLSSNLFKNMQSLQSAGNISITYENESVFLNCENLKDLTLSSDTYELGKSFAENAKNLILNNNLFDNIVIIQDNAFKGASLGKTYSLKMPQVKYIGDNAFSGCNSIELIELGKKDILYIGNNCFSGVKSSFKLLYPGTQTEWNSVSDDYRSQLQNKVYFYSETAPENALERLWYYDENNNPVIWVYSSN